MRAMVLLCVICLAYGQLAGAQVSSGTPVADEPSVLGGVYEGFEVCADCEAIAVRLTLTPVGGPGGGAFTLKRLYVGAPKRTAAGARVGKGYTIAGSWTYSAADALHGKLCLAYTEGQRKAEDCYSALQGRELRPILDADLPETPVNEALVKMQRWGGKEYPVLAYETRR